MAEQPTAPVAPEQPKPAEKPPEIWPGAEAEAAETLRATTPAPVKEPTRDELLAEGFRRDLLPPDMKAAYEEAIKRGLVPAPRTIWEKLTGQRGERYQTWPERMVREAIHHPVAATTGEYGEFGTPEYKQKMIEGSLATATFAVPSARPFTAPAIGRNVMTPEKLTARASDVIGRRFEQDVKGGGLSAVEAIEKVRDAASRGSPLTLADVSGENVRALAGSVTRRPGESRSFAQKFLQERDIGSDPKMVGPRTPAQRSAAERLDKELSETLSSSDKTAFRAAETLIEERSKSATPHYKDMEALDNIWSPRLQEFLNDPTLKRGLARGYELERLDSLAAGRPFDPTKLGVNLDAEGNIVLLKVPNMRVLDIGKRGLDAMIAGERNEITGKLSTMGRSLDQVRKAYLRELDELDTTGVYRRAREAWAGPSASLDAIKAGKTAFTRSPEEIASEIAELSPVNQEFYRIGVADTIRTRLAKTGFSGDEAKAIIGNAWTRRQLEPVFPGPQEFERWLAGEQEPEGGPIAGPHYVPPQFGLTEEHSCL